MQQTKYKCNNYEWIAEKANVCTGQISLCESDRLPFIIEKDTVRYGTMKCNKCNSLFPIIDFIPILLRDPFSYLRENFSLIDTYFNHIGSPFPAKIRKSLYSIFLEKITSPKEPVIRNKSGYKSRHIPLLMSRFKAYYESYTGNEWDSGLFSLGRPDLTDKDCLYSTVRHFMNKYRMNDHNVTLDIGSNLGGFTFLLSSCFNNAFGLDTSFESVHNANISAENKKVSFSYRSYKIEKELEYINKPRFIVSKGEFTPFEDNSIDFLLCLNLVDVVPDPALLIRELSRITRQKGRVIISTPFLESSNGVTCLLNISDNEIKSLNILLDKNGFKVLEEKDGILWKLNEYNRKIVLYNLYCNIIEKQ